MTKTLAPPKPKYSRHFSSLKKFLRSLLPKPTSLHILIILPFSNFSGLVRVELALSSPLKIPYN